jgi:hypothetical protein
VTARTPRIAPRRGQGPFVALCVAIILGALVSVLLLNTTMAEGAYEAKNLRVSLATLGERRADLITAIDAKATPESLAEQATALGMIPASAIGFISLTDGTVTLPGGNR